MRFSDKQIHDLKAYISDLKPSWLGRFIFRYLPFRKKIVLSNLNNVFGEVLTLEEIKTLAQAFYGHLIKSIQETFLLRFVSPKSLLQRVVILGQEHMWALLDSKTKGAILITGHFGSWEFAPLIGMQHFPEFRHRFYFVRKMIKNKFIESLLFKRYYDAGLNVIPKKNSLNKVCDVLEQNNAVIFVMDQHASLNNRDGIPVEFFGKLAGTYRSPAIIAKYTGVPVLPVRGYRRSDGQHVLEFFPPLSWISCENEKDEIYQNTKKYNEYIEKFILDYPEQWIWLHKRWKI